MSVERLRSLVPPLALLLVLALRGAADWRYFERFLGDHGWPLRVAERLRAGERIYLDVGWDYGPLPVQVLAALFAIVERDFDGMPLLSQERVWAAFGATYDLHASTRDGRWALYCPGRHAADRGPQPATN